MKILLIDIETAPNKVYTWGLWNQNISINQIQEPGYTLCWAAKWHGGDKIMFRSTHNDGKQKMLEEAYELLDNADAVVHYNGTRFDIPILNQEFALMGWPPPSPIKHIDLLRTARSQFRLASNKLDYVASYLGLGSKVQHKGMPLWTGCMAGDAASWKIMERYNKGDVILLGKVYRALKPWVKNHPNFGLYTQKGKPVCPNCGSIHLVKRGLYNTATLSYQRYRCSSCGTWSRDRYNNIDKEQKKNVMKSI
jgi:predicted RNA-binding Zn-ribbon protein involved in translation (DUF1610 family)